MSAPLKALVAIQSGLKAPKDQKAKAYRYRNIEDVNEAVKPLAAGNGCAVVYSDSFEVVDTTLVCVSKCTLLGEDGEISAVGCAVVDTAPKFMSREQASGAASSYARKYAACGLFAIDDSSADPDAREPSARPQVKADPGKAERNNAVIRLNEAITAYCESSGGDFAKTKEGIKERADFEDTAEFYRRVAEEFESMP